MLKAIAEKPMIIGSLEAENDLLPWHQRFAWLMGGVGDYLIALCILNLAMPIYNIGLGVSAVWIGWALAIPRALDAVIDPLIGNLSDNTRSRWGRRRPYLFVSIIICSLTFALLWLPPAGLGKQGLFIYFLGISLVYFCSYAFFNIAYNALGLELCSNIEVRTRLWSQRVIFTQAIGLLMPWLYKLCMLPVFGGSEVVGVRYVGSVMAMIILAAGILPALFCRERAQTQSQPKIKILDGMKLILKNRPFLLISGVNLLFQVGIFIIAPVGLYINIFYVCKGDKALAALLMGYSGTIFSIVGISTPALVARMANRWGKKPVVATAIVLESVGYLASWFLMDPRHPYLQLVGTPLSALGAIIVFALMQAMVADICDLDEWNTGLRREGMFGAITALLIKASIAATSVIGGYLLILAGAREGVVQSAQTILLLRLEYIVFPFSLMALAGLLLWFYPIHESQIRQTRIQLDQRRIGIKECTVCMQ